jgi:hypothetical protein
MADSGYEHELAAVSEGICPQHLIRLAPDGWCTACGAWWYLKPGAIVGKRWLPPSEEVPAP